MNSNRRHYPAIAQKFPELQALQGGWVYDKTSGKRRILTTAEANKIRTEAYRALYDSLTIQEKVFADRKIAELRAIIPDVKLGKGGAWELLIALAQLMEWLNWPERG